MLLAIGTVPASTPTEGGPLSKVSQAGDCSKGGQPQPAN